MRPFGLEIECYVWPRKKERYRDWNGKFYYDDESDDSVWMRLEKKLPNWEVHEDGSLDEHGVELSSPIIATSADWKEIKRAFSVLNAEKATVNLDCGLHVHHDVSDFDDDDVKRVILSWSNNQETIDNFVQKHRLYNEYCMPWEEHELEEIDRHIKYPEKYKALSIAARPYLGTIEIRQHHGTLNFEEAKAWILFGRAFIESVKKRKNPIQKCDPETLLRYTRTYKRATENLLQRIK